MALSRLLWLYEMLYACYGPQGWWPAQDAFEMVVGAILTQGAAWSNVEKAIARLRAAGALDPATMRRLPSSALAELVRPSGYYNVKAAKLKAFAARLGEAYGDDLRRLFSLEVETLRRELLSIYGIGPETVDSIILYGAGKPVFVVDAYTVRIASRLGLCSEKEGYNEVQRLFTKALARDAACFNEFHALLVRHGKEVCRKLPLCSRCCLAERCPYPREGAR